VTERTGVETAVSAAAVGVVSETEAVVSETEAEIERGTETVESVAVTEIVVMTETVGMTEIAVTTEVVVTIAAVVAAQRMRKTKTSQQKTKRSRTILGHRPQVPMEPRLKKRLRRRRLRRMTMLQSAFRK